MKRTIISVIFIMMILCISACGKEHVKNETKEVTKEPYELVEEVEKKDEKMSEHEILEMSNYMNGQMTIINGAWMYGVSFNSNGNGVLSKIKSDESELTRLTKYYPTYINVIDGYTMLQMVVMKQVLEKLEYLEKVKR